MQRARKNAHSNYLMTLVAMILMSLSGASSALSGLIAPDHMLRAYLEAQGVIVAPILAATAYLRRFPRALIRSDVFLAVQCVTVTIGMVLLNRELSFPIALYQAFTLPLIPTAYNLLVGLRFIFAAPMAVVYLGLFLVNAFTRSDFPREANSFLIVSYAFTTLGSLIANFRVEHAERVNFLQMWRSRLSDTLARHANRRLTMLARTDALTGIANRREFDARMIVEFAKAESTGKPLAVIVLDIDNFKLYNDGHGHPEGDKCIRLVARAISEGAGGPPNLVSRIGGEEFAVVLPNAAVERAAAIAQQIRIAVAALQLPHPALGDRRVVTVSLGVACLNPARPETPEAVIGRADAALYRAKRGGRDRAEVELRVVNA